MKHQPNRWIRQAVYFATRAMAQLDKACKYEENAPSITANLLLEQALNSERRMRVCMHYYHNNVEWTLLLDKAIYIR